MIARWIIAILVAAILSAGGGYGIGYKQGKGRAEAQANQATLAALTEALTTHQTLLVDSKAASVRLSKLLAERYRQDQTTTQELKDALAENAELRAAVRYSDRVVRILTEARQRAVDAATGGLDGALQRSDPVPDE
ncbi:hypothetical protein [Alloalcanivorax xenomutans]